MLQEVFVSQARHVVFAANKSLEETDVDVVEKVEALVGSPVFNDSGGDFFEVSHSGSWVVELGDEFEMPSIGGNQQFSKVAEAIDGFFDRREFVHGGSVTLFHLAVVLEKGNIVRSGFDA